MGALRQRKPKTPKKQTKNTFLHPFKKVPIPLNALKGFEIGRRIGKGSFGKVYKAEKNGKKCVLKFVDLKDHEGDFAMEGILTEWLSAEKIGPSFFGKKSSWL